MMDNDNPTSLKWIKHDHFFLSPLQLSGKHFEVDKSVHSQPTGIFEPTVHCTKTTMAWPRRVLMS